MLPTQEHLIELSKPGLSHANDGYIFIPIKELNKKEIEKLTAFDRTHYESKGRHVRGIEKLAGQRS